MKKLMKDIFLKLMFNILRNYMELQNALPFLPETMKIERIEKFTANLQLNTFYTWKI